MILLIPSLSKIIRFYRHLVVNGVHLVGIFTLQETHQIKIITNFDFFDTIYGFKELVFNIQKQEKFSTFGVLTGNHHKMK